MSQDKILEYCIKNCLFDSWGTVLLENACLAASLDKNYWKIDFPNGAVDVIDYFNEKANLRLAEEFRPNAPGVTAKIRSAVKLRFELNAPYKEQIRAMLSVYALHPIRAAKAVARTADTIWRLCGDTATDWNYYTKRGLLAGVYSSTLMFWLNDTSENNGDTWEFLDRRLAEVGKLNKGIGGVKERLRKFKFSIVT